MKPIKFKNMFERFFEEDEQYIGFFRFPEDSEKIPGHLVIKKNVIEGQIYSVPKDFLSRTGLPIGLGLNTSRILNATGVFRLKGGKDIEVSIFGIQIVSGSSSQLGIYKIYCQSMILKSSTNSLESVFPQKLVLKIKGLEEWFEQKAVGHSHEGNKISVFSEKRIVEDILTTDQVSINLECYANFNIQYRDNIVKEFVTIVIGFKSNTNLFEALKWKEKIRRVFSLFFRKQLRVEEASFFIPEVDLEFFYVHSDSRDFYKRAIKHRNESIIRYSDSILFREVLKNFLLAEPRLSQLMETYFLMELNHSLYNVNAFLTWVFELDAFIKKAKQNDISKEEAVKDLSKELVQKLEQKNDPLLEELFNKWYALTNEKAKSFGEALQSRLLRYFSSSSFFQELISVNPEDFFDKVVKTRNHLAHPALKPKKNLIPNQDMPIYQSKLRLMVYCVILLELGVEERLLIERLKVIPYPIVKPLN